MKQNDWWCCDSDYPNHSDGCTHKKTGNTESEMKIITLTIKELKAIVEGLDCGGKVYDEYEISFGLTSEGKRIAWFADYPDEGFVPIDK
jgi:hypothetical protein